ncbi:MAG: two-component system sensor histidine kinase PhoR [Gammaproteobacteria bacterium]|nr:MAG: two-component system sensor histidine kinase PhoR [Gammaproteobacteria bacterium]
MGGPWSTEFRRLVVALLAGAGLGALAGAPAWGVVLALAALLLWHGMHLRQLLRWLDSKGRRFHPPDATGVWGDVYLRIYRLQQRNRKRKRKLGKILHRFQEATAALPDAVVVLDRNDEAEWWNDSAARLLGLQSPRDAGQRITNLLRHPDFRAYLEGGDFGRPGPVIPSPVVEGTQLAIRVVPYAHHQRLLIARDISHRQRLEQVRRDFVANVSHELRTPLTVLTGYLETLDESADLEGETAGMVREMREQARRMQQIVDDLLMLSRLENGLAAERSEDVEVPALLERLVDEARRLSGSEGHRLRLEADPGLHLLGNRNELRSLFSNLIVNAVQYTPPGGEIGVRWYRDGEGRPVFEVRDTGIGIPARHIPRLTERFYRVDVGRSRKRGGTGLGLAIVKHVLIRHGGRLEIESEVGVGSRFRALFPAERALAPGGRQPTVLPVR